LTGPATTPLKVLVDRPVQFVAVLVHLRNSVVALPPCRLTHSSRAAPLLLKPSASLKRDVCVAGSSVTSPVAALTMCLLLKYKAKPPFAMLRSKLCCTAMYRPLLLPNLPKP